MQLFRHTRKRLELVRTDGWLTLDLMQKQCVFIGAKMVDCWHAVAKQKRLRYAKQQAFQDLVAG